MKCEKSLWCVNESVNIGNRIHVRVDTSGYLSSPSRAVHVQYNTGYPPLRAPDPDPVVKSTSKPSSRVGPEIRSDRHRHGISIGGPGLSYVSRPFSSCLSLISLPNVLDSS